ncbi:MAG: 2-oxoglutarate dehydrogenase E1 component, partial [Chloroflexi bacterium]|nr:2-oxoglutarate dehydrogenase E1 component [Chloroflexota bacterium]
SHLEFVNPVIEGMVRAAQDTRRLPGTPTQNNDAAVAVQIHGDAAFPGQGINAETLNLGCLPGYTTGGTLHVIANNQLGFTTEPNADYPGRYSSDTAKGYSVPVIHVNADRPAESLAAVRLAHAYREQFHKDALIDLIGYRRWGHNEGDDPAFTQPAMYENIVAHPSVRDLWAQQAIAGGALTQAEADAMSAAVTEQMQQIRTASNAAGERHSHVKLTSYPMLEGIATAVPAATLHQLNDELMTYPDGFEPNQRVARQIERRRTALGSEAGVDWGHAESLALASILATGTPIRMSGQDTERGTFSQRHAVLHGSDGDAYTPLKGFASSRASFAIYNSPLSENAALGFEFGYSVAAPEALVIWEAQYGDFVNGAQVIIDQFIVSARSKWGQTPALVMLLPNGHEGAGPEHSSGRVERFLQLAADDNLRIATCTTAAQYFHLLRRQAALMEHDPRPLVVMTPKSLLRLPRAQARLEDLADGSFQTVIDDAEARARAASITRVVLCSGKVYYDLTSSEARTGAEPAAVVRVEELYPFPAADLARVLTGYPHLRELVWVQEEPKNMGAWSYIAPRLRAIVDRDMDVAYVGRVDRSSPAEGSPGRHRAEQDRIVKAAFSGVSAPQQGSRRESHAG